MSVNESWITPLVAWSPAEQPAALKCDGLGPLSTFRAIGRGARICGREPDNYRIEREQYRECAVVGADCWTAMPCFQPPTWAICSTDHCLQSDRRNT